MSGGRLRHVALAVPDLERAIEELSRVHGLQAGPIRVNEAQGVRMAYLDLGNAKLELLAATRPDSPVGRFLARNPRGALHHVSFGAEDLDAACGAVLDAGGRLAGAPARNVDGARIAFIHPEGAGGLLVELEEEAQ